MGQRHQIFIVARVRSKGEKTGHRRCVAAYHHQWCYGRTALQCLSRFVKLASQPDNAASIRRDLANVDGNYVEESADEEEREYVPCPFIVYLVQLAWNVNLDDVPVYVAGVSFDNAVLDARMYTGDGDNNDGITIVDVTDPTNPTYCFNDIGGPPLTARTYVRKYYPRKIRRPAATTPPASDDRAEEDGDTDGEDEGNEDEGNEDEGNEDEGDEDEGGEDSDGGDATERMVRKTISALKDVPLMSVDALVEAWPGEYTRARKKVIAAGTHVPGTLSTDEPLPETAAASITSPPAQPTVETLADISLRQAVVHAVNEGDIEPIRESLSTTDQREVILNVLNDMSQLPPAGAKLLNLAIGREQPADVLDLSGIELSPSAILGLVTAASSTLLKLDLTGNKRVTILDLTDILSAASNMRQLIIFDCPLISDEDIYSLLSSSPKLFYTLEFIGHSAFFRRVHDSVPLCPYTPAFTVVVQEPMRQPLITSLPYFTPSRLLRSIYTLLKPVADTAAASAALRRLDEQGRKANPNLAGLAFSGIQMFSSTAVLHAAFTTWYDGADSVTDAVSIAEGQEPDPCGLRANTQRITLLPQMSTSLDGWLLLVQPGMFGMGGGSLSISCKHREEASVDAESTENAGQGFKAFSLSGFVEAMKEEGRPAPSVEDVAALESVIETAFGQNRFDSAGALQLLKEVAMRSRMYGSF
ncbi:hypothetical protein PENSPDRAFT_750106 [Peniophora sp. CONT]|nr:hypothetical protein PENSPDRAFT_750106 [Peniophora sp. CONT]